MEKPFFHELHRTLFYKYRVSTKTVSTFVFWISRLPKGLEISSWTFFNCPFRVDFKNIRFYIIWWNLARDICKILLGGNFKNQHFLFIFWWSSALTHMSFHELSCMSPYVFFSAPMSTHERSQTPLITSENQWVWCLCTMSTHECSLRLGIMIISAYLHKWSLLSAYECS